MMGLFKAMREAENGEIYYDAHQGWELIVHYYDGYFYLLVGDPDDEDEQQNIKFSQDMILPLVEAAKKRSKTIISTLSDGIGADVWTDYVKKPNFNV